MKYMGSKNRIAKHILPIMVKDAERKSLSIWNEPFVGGCGMIDKVPDTFVKNGYDINKQLIDMYNYIKENDFHNLPIDIPKSLYDDVRNSYKAKDGRYEDYMIGWVGFMASANGRYFDGGYSGISKTKIGTERNYIDESIRGITKQLPLLKNINFATASFDELDFKDSLIYADIPYKNTKQYALSKNFNYDKFYDWCIKQSENNIVYISEYDMPKDRFNCVWEMEVKSSLSANGKNGGSKNSIERLYKVNGA